MIKKIHIYDIDGTIVCSLHRYRTINGKIDLQYWRDNEHKAGDDTLLPLAEQYILDCLNPNIFVILATSRVLDNHSYIFIREQLGVPDHIVSRRGNNDSRRAFDLKTAGIMRVLERKGLTSIEKHFWEDNRETCEKVAASIGGIGHFVPSLQGH